MSSLRPSSSRKKSRKRNQQLREKEARLQRKVQGDLSNLLDYAVNSTRHVIPGILKTPAIKALKVADQASRGSFNLMYNTGRSLAGIYGYSKIKFNNARYRFNEAHSKWSGKLRGRYNHIMNNDWFKIYKEIELLEKEINDFLKHEDLDIDIDTLSNYIRNKPVEWSGDDDDARPTVPYPTHGQEFAGPVFITDIIDRLYKYWEYSKNLDKLNDPKKMEVIDDDIKLDIIKHKIVRDYNADYRDYDIYEECDDLFEPDGKNYWYEYQILHMIIDKDDDSIIDFTVSNCINRQELENFLKYKKYEWAKYTNNPWEEPVPDLPELLPSKPRKYTNYESSSDSGNSSSDSDYSPHDRKVSVSSNTSIYDSPNSSKSSPVGEPDNDERKNNDMDDDIFRAIHDAEYRRRQDELQNPGHLEISDDMDIDDMKVDFMEQGIGRGRGRGRGRGAKKHTKKRKRKKEKDTTNKHTTNKKRKTHHKKKKKRKIGTKKKQ